MGARGGEPARRDRGRGSAVCKADCQDGGGSGGEGLAGDGAAVEEDLLGEDVGHGGEEEGLGEDEAGWMVTTLWLEGFKRRERGPSSDVRDVLVFLSVMTKCFCLTMNAFHSRKL